MIHVGVSGIATKITLEQQAHNTGYQRDDVLGCRPENHCCVHGAEDCKVSKLDMQKVCDDINSMGSEVEAVVSHDPGR